MVLVPDCGVEVPSLDMAMANQGDLVLLSFNPLSTKLLKREFTQRDMHHYSFSQH